MKLTNLYLLIAVLSILFAAACAKKPEAYTNNSCIDEKNAPSWAKAEKMGTLCPTDEWYAELQQLQALNKKYSPPADVQQQMKEKMALLQSTIPPGFDWNDAKKVFVRKSAPVMPSQPVPVVPAK